MKPSEIIMEKAKIQASKTFDVISDIILVPYVVNQILDFLDEQAEEGSEPKPGDIYVKPIKNWPYGKSDIVRSMDGLEAE